VNISIPAIVKPVKEVSIINGSGVKPLPKPSKLFRGDGLLAKYWNEEKYMPLNIQTVNRNKPVLIFRSWIM
jgi:hypothetical protein